MTKKANFHSSEIRSGFLVFITFCVLLGLFFMSGTFQLWKENYDIHITFRYISGLQANAPVHVAGFKVGKVTDIRLLSDEEPGVLVTVSIDKGIVLRKDAEAYLNVAGFMGEMFVELFAGSPETPRLQPGERIRGTDPIPLME
jgi:phospholipid/cholesterol/gamma-HCH transport system substrate-binding protein